MLVLWLLCAMPRITYNPGGTLLSNTFLLASMPPLVRPGVSCAGVGTYS